jgi:hypothetical protein
MKGEEEAMPAAARGVGVVVLGDESLDEAGQLRGEVRALRC